MITGGYMGYYILVGLIALVSWAVSSKLKSKFKEYSQIHLQNGMSGAEIARKMLSDNGINDVKVISVQGQLTDHYNPANKTVNLSEPVYNERNAAAAAVAAHECGHAVQHAKAYSWLTMRSKLVPVVSVASRMSTFVIIGGVVLMSIIGSGLGMTVALIGLGLFAMGTIFAFITLPVEYDASNRALAWLESANMLTRQEHDGAKDALKWAARTYVVAAIGSLATLLYFALQILGSRR
ncbi:zinc metallopeptidase [Leeuwenhoekiella parthenopeia]|uniref:Zinc metallopeptidase n=1 Tax=Leeuwenhoekiella parthenopeia TaxID=2890320 RepID=A0ABS8GNV6_9FLAO|nr:zinc metallopeptidase [Leeuwenhoekiella parthenopeia]MCC4211671.1 zinc metallopeptidase [Leeuwenhoekiella parthenopeia]